MYANRDQRRTNELLFEFRNERTLKELRCQTPSQTDNLFSGRVVTVFIFARNHPSPNSRFRSFTQFFTLVCELFWVRTPQNYFVFSILFFDTGWVFFVAAFWINLLFLVTLWCEWNQWLRWNNSILLFFLVKFHSTQAPIFRRVNLKSLQLKFDKKTRFNILYFIFPLRIFVFLSNLKKIKGRWKAFLKSRGGRKCRRSRWRRWRWRRQRRQLQECLFKKCIAASATEGGGK